MSSAPLSLRRRVETASRPVLLRLHALPRLLVPTLTLGLVAVGAFTPVPVALTAFAVLFVLLGWIAYLSWPVVAGSGRVLRVVMLGLLVVLAAMRLRG